MTDNKKITSLFAPEDEYNLDIKQEEKALPTKRPNTITSSASAASAASTTSWTSYVRNENMSELDYLNHTMRRNSPRTYTGIPNRLVDRSINRSIDRFNDIYSPIDLTNDCDGENIGEINEEIDEEIDDSQIIIIQKELSRYKEFLLNRQNQCRQKMKAKDIAHLCVIIARSCMQNVEIISVLQNEINRIAYYTKGQRFVDKQCSNIKLSLELIKTYMNELFDNFIVEKTKIRSKQTAEHANNTSLAKLSHDIVTPDQLIA